MRSEIINIKTDPLTKKQAQKVARDLGFGLSTLLNAYLKQLIKDKVVYFAVSKHTVPVLSLAEIKRKVLPVLRSHKVKRAAIFGSYARGDATGDSDVDILVELPKGASLLDLSSLKNHLEDSLKKKVDVIEYGGIKPALKDNILSEQIPIL